MLWKEKEVIKIGMCLKKDYAQTNIYFLNVLFPLLKSVKKPRKNVIKSFEIKKLWDIYLPRNDFFSYILFINYETLHQISSYEE